MRLISSISSVLVAISAAFDAISAAFVSILSLFVVILPSFISILSVFVEISAVFVAIFSVFVVILPSLSLILFVFVVIRPSLSSTSLLKLLISSSAWSYKTEHWLKYPSISTAEQSIYIYILCYILAHILYINYIQLPASRWQVIVTTASIVYGPFGQTSAPAPQCWPSTPTDA